jgi:Fe-S cluster biosynthesis and repair protein YggX
VLAVPDVELVTHDRKEEGVGAVQQLPVDDGVDARVRWNPVRAAAIPAQSVAVFGFHGSLAPDHNGGGGVGDMSGRTVFCVKFQKELPGLDAPPWPGELGQRIFENVSAQAWMLWEERQKMILNEYRIMPWQKEGQEIIRQQLEEFFFGEGAALPPGYVPEQR